MATKANWLKDVLGNILLPKTYSRYVYDEDSGDNMENTMAEMQEQVDSAFNDIDTINQTLTAKVPFGFGVDANGNYGYKKAGADTVIPFKNPQGTLTLTNPTNGTDCTNYATVKTSGLVKPSGTKSITSNGSVDVSAYATASVAVPASTAVTSASTAINEATLWASGRSKTYSVTAGNIVVAIVNSSNNSESGTHSSSISFSGSKTNLIDWSGYTSKNNNNVATTHCHTKILVFKATSNGTLTLTTSLSGSYITGTMQAIILK